MHRDLERILFSESEILAGIDRLSVEVSEVYSGVEFTVVAILKGSCIFVADLVRRLPNPLEMAFVAARSYGDHTTSGELDIDLLPAESELSGRRLLLVDDILDTGRTLFHVRTALLDRGATEVRTCVFLDKPARRVIDIEADFRVFEVEDQFVVGYGLDHAGRYRNLPFVGILRPELIEGDQEAGR